MTNNLTVRQAIWDEAGDQLQAIRQAVFVDEQGVAVDEEWDGQDQQAVHFLALHDGMPVGCARLQADGKIQRMAVLPAFRGQGVGAAILNQVVGFARARGDATIYLDAQLQALDFYRRFGFEAQGEVFQDAGIAHKRMLWQRDAVIRLAGPHDSLQALRQCAYAGRQTLDILTNQLSPALYSDQQLVDAVGRLTRRSRRSRVRILVKDTRPLRGRQHPLVDLAQRLPSRMGLRTLRDIPQDLNGSFAIADREAVVFFNDEAECAGFFRASARAEAQHSLEEFDHLWEHYGFVDPNLKRLSL